MTMALESYIGERRRRHYYNNWSKSRPRQIYVPTPVLSGDCNPCFRGNIGNEISSPLESTPKTTRETPEAHHSKDARAAENAIPPETSCLTREVCEYRNGTLSNRRILKTLHTTRRSTRKKVRKDNHKGATLNTMISPIKHLRKTGGLQIPVTSFEHLQAFDKFLVQEDLSKRKDLVSSFCSWCWYPIAMKDIA
jgi:hypothetical protein